MTPSLSVGYLTIVNGNLDNWPGYSQVPSLSTDVETIGEQLLYSQLCFICQGAAPDWFSQNRN